jgi:toxin ParE1/3/4
MRLTFAQPARDDLAGIVRHIAADNPYAARAMNDAIVAAALRLRRFPGFGRPGHREGTRELSVPGMSYLLVYVVEPERVNIVAVLHGARDLPGALEGRPPEAP